MACNTKYKILQNEIIGKGDQGIVYLTMKGKKEYVTKNPVGKIEAEISVIMSEKVGPKVYEVYECKKLEDTKNITKNGEKLKVKGRFIVMEKLEGMDLADLILGETFLEPEFAELVVKKIKKMHKLGYYHNDLFAPNIFVTFDKNGNPLDAKIIDFGKTKKMSPGKDLKDLKDLLQSLFEHGSENTDKIIELTELLETEIEKYEKPKKKVSIKKPSIKKPILKKPKKRTILIKKKVIKIKKRPIKVIRRKL